MVKRIAIPHKTEIEILLLNAHSCCICKDLNKTNIQIHHIDGNKNNNIISNLAVVCQYHHDLLEAKFKLTKNFTIKEVKGYKASWEMQIAKRNNFEGVHFLPYREKEILSKFSPEFLEANDKVKPLDYYSWHEKEADWQTGTGELISITHKEVNTLWNDFNKYSIYESSLLNFLSSGGKVNRTFTLGAELQNPKIFSKIVFRHSILGFNPQIIKLDSLNSLKRKINVDFDTIGALNHRFGYFYQQENNLPYFARTMVKRLVEKIYEEKKILDSSGNSVNFEYWQKRCPDVFKLDPSDKKEVESICEIISSLSKSL